MKQNQYFEDEKPNVRIDRKMKKKERRFIQHLSDYDPDSDTLWEQYEDIQTFQRFGR